MSPGLEKSVATPELYPLKQPNLSIAEHSKDLLHRDLLPSSQLAPSLGLHHQRCSLKGLALNVASSLQSRTPSCGQLHECRTDRHEHERGGLGDGGDGHEAAARQVVAREVVAAGGRVVVDLPPLAARLELAAVGESIAAVAEEAAVPTA